MIKRLGFLLGFLITLGFFLGFYYPDFKDTPQTVHKYHLQPIEKKEQAKTDKRPADLAAKETAENKKPLTTVQEKSIENTVPESKQQSHPIVQTFVFKFWTPFQSRYAANGFANSLFKSTGVEIHVLELAVDKFQVAFYYHNEEQRQAKLNKINHITGLKLP